MAMDMGRLTLTEPFNLATTFTVDTADLASNGSVIGSSGNDSLVIKSTAFDLSSTTLTSVEILQAGLNSATTFTLDQADLASGGSVVGSSGSDTLTGYAVGGGLEWKFSQNWSAKAEYLYLGLGDSKLTADNGDFVRINNDVQTVRVGLNYHF